MAPAKPYDELPEMGGYVDDAPENEGNNHEEDIFQWAQQAGPLFQQNDDWEWHADEDIDVPIDEGLAQLFENQAIIPISINHNDDNDNMAWLPEEAEHEWRVAEMSDEQNGNVEEPNDLFG